MPKFVQSFAFHALCTCLLVLGLSQNSHASSSLALSYNYHMGPSDNSFQTASSFSGILTSEGGKGIAKLSFGVAGNFAKNILYFQTLDYAVTTLGGEVRVGFSLQPLPKNFLAPFLSAHGIFGANIYKNASPPTGASENQLGITWGWEAEAGMSIPVSGKNRLRLSGAYRVLRSPYASININLDAFAFRAAMVF